MASSRFDGDGSIRSKIDNRLSLAGKTLNMTRRMIVRIGDRTPLNLREPTQHNNLSYAWVIKSLFSYGCWRL
jgi:hypothetical protein